MNDFSAYRNLSGCTVKGYYGCSICEEETYSCRLNHGKKNSYTRCKRFLPRNHPYRKQRKAFDGKQEFRSPPQILIGVRNFQTKKKSIEFAILWGKNVNRGKSEVNNTNCWKKKSIFFDLEYWKYLHVRHNLDVMHIEKKFCESIIGTLLNIASKIKDGLNSHLDFVEMGSRSELAPRFESKRTYLPLACYTLSIMENRVFFQTISQFKVPYWFYSNL